MKTRCRMDITIQFVWPWEWRLVPWCDSCSQGYRVDWLFFDVAFYRA